MVWRYCRRIWWERMIRWTIGLSVVLLVAWTYRSGVVHGVNLLTSPVYRQCQARRNAYLEKMTDAAGGADDDKAPGGHQNLFVTMAYHGRLGNWMFQYASLLGIARDNGFTPYFPRWHGLAFHFELSHLRPSPADCLAVIEDPKPMSYVPAVTHLPKANVTLDGYFQSWKYFRSINDRIRQEFRFVGNTERTIRKNFNDYVGRHVRAGREVISIHVRRGDVIKPGAQRLGFKPAPAEYFVNAMRYMVKRHPFCVFLVVSDDLEWCRKNIQSVGLKYYHYHYQDGGKEQELVGFNDGAGKVFVVNANGGEEPLHPDAKHADKLIEHLRDKHNVLNLKDVKNVDTNDDSDIIIENKDGSGGVLSSTPPIVIAPLSTGVYDLGLLTLANHSIMSVGSFGWWGAWLAGGEVVYYRDWPQKDHAVYYQWTRQDFFPPDWVPLSGSAGVGIGGGLLDWGSGVVGLRGGGVVTRLMVVWFVVRVSGSLGSVLSLS